MIKHSQQIHLPNNTKKKEIKMQNNFLVYFSTLRSFNEFYSYKLRLFR